MRTRIGIVTLLAAGLVATSVAWADEIVYFANGAEMPVRSHTIEKEKDMVKLDLGGNSFISFPISMVDKIADAGKDVFLNPAYHASNQAVEGSHYTPLVVQDMNVRNGGGNVGFRPQPGTNNRSNGTSLGESAGGADTPAYSKSGAGVSVLPVTNGHGLISRAAKPTIDVNSPIPQVPDAMIDNTPANMRAKPMLLKPRVQQGPPPADAPTESAPAPDQPAATDDSSDQQ